MNFFILLSFYKYRNGKIEMKKCSKYEAIFTFGNDETLKHHVETCEDCKKEQEVMDKISALLKEVKPYYIEKRKNTAKLKMACAMFFILLSTTTLGIINLNTDVSDIIKYGTTLSADDLGLPVDSYGLLMVE
jgi:hypothetical protein